MGFIYFSSAFSNSTLPKPFAMKPFALLLLLFILSAQAEAQQQYNWRIKTKGAIHASAALDSTTVYIGSNDSCVYALNKLNGNIQWQVKTEGQVRSQLVVDGKKLFVTTTAGEVLCINTATAQVQWNFQTNGEQQYDMWDYYISSVSIANNTLYFGSGDSCIYALHASTGEQLWKHKTNGIVHATPIIHQNTVLVGSFDGYFYALHSKTGKMKWKFKTVGDRYFPKGEIQKGAVIYKNAVIFGSRDYNIYAIDITTGRGLWNKKEIGSWIIATPLVYNNKIYFGTSDTHQFYCMNPELGTVEWIARFNMRVYGTAMAHNKSIIIPCFNGKLYQANSTTGELTTTFQTPESKKHYTSIFKSETHFQDNFQLYGKDMQQPENKILQLGAILSTPVTDTKYTYFGDSNGYFYALPLQ